MICRILCWLVGHQYELIHLYDSSIWVCARCSKTKSVIDDLDDEAEIIAASLHRLSPSRKVHDYTSPRWGHGIARFRSDSSVAISVMGWGRGIVPGDDLLIKVRGHEARQFRVLEIKYKADPPDMWSATVIDCHQGGSHG